MSRMTIILVRLALLGVALAAWEVLPRTGAVNPALLPPLGDVLAVLMRLIAQPAFEEAIGVTTAELAVAFVIAVPLGVALGVLAVERPYFGAVFKPMLFYVFSVPKSIFLPVFILVLGIGFHQKVVYAVFQSIFIIVISTMTAVESVQPEHILVARAYGATRGQILRRVYWPSMMPILLEMLRVAMIFNFTGVMIAEMYAARSGLGHMISNWGENYMLPELFADVILLAGAAILFNEAVRYLESKCSIWRA